MSEIIPDSIIVAVSGFLAVAGLLLLYFVSPDPLDQQYTINGTVLSTKRGEALVSTVVIVRIQNVSVGDTIAVPVFWAGNGFVATK